MSDGEGCAKAGSQGRSLPEGDIWLVGRRARVGRPLGVKGGPRQIAKQVALLSSPKGGTEALPRRMGRGLKPVGLQGSKGDFEFPAAQWVGGGNVKTGEKGSWASS